jgi:hypothetical protein
MYFIRLIVKGRPLQYRTFSLCSCILYLMMVEWTTETCRREITKKDVLFSWVVLVWNGLLMMALRRLIGKTCYCETAHTHRFESTAKQNECWFSSFRNRPYQVVSLQSAHLLHRICLGVCEPQLFLMVTALTTSGYSVNVYRCNGNCCSRRYTCPN